MPVAKNKPVAIAAVEAAYDLDGDTHGWLERLAAVAGTELDLGLGVQAVLYGKSGDHFVAVEQGLCNSPPELASYVVELPRRMSLEGQSRIAALPSGLYAYCQTEPGRKEPEVFGRVWAEGAPRGIQDWLAVVASTRDTFVVLGGLTRTRKAVPEKMRRRWKSVAPHITAGLRLRSQLADTGQLTTEVVLSPTGRVEHAEGESRESPRLRDALRRAVLQREQALRARQEPEEMEALALWPGLIDGRLSLVDRFDSDGRRYVVAIQGGPSCRDPRALTPRERQVVRLAQDGLASEEIADELGVSASAVATHMSGALSKLGLARREMLLTEPGTDTSFTEVVDLMGARIVASSTLLDPREIGDLSRAENLIVRGVVRGLSNDAIANERRVAVSTVANQIQAIFGKLRVRSRAELVEFVMRRSMH